MGSCLASLFDDVRYTAKSAAIWRRKGLDIPQDKIVGVGEENRRKATRGASANVRIWNRNPVRVESTGEIRYQIPYTLSGFGYRTQNLIRTSLKKMSEDICIDFVEKKSYQITKKGDDIINIQRGTLCYSHVGRAGGPQELTIGPTCESSGTIQHEAMHALGFHHEQIRPDRDEYVGVHLKEVQQSKGR